MTRILIIDYGMGNIQSVHNAFARTGVDVYDSSDPAELHNADAVVLPGVGAFGEAMTNLKRNELDKHIVEAVNERRVPLLGVCLGMQLLAEHSEERGEFQGLGLIPGVVRRISVPDNLPLPHVGWNDVHITSSSPIFTAFKDGDAFYFVHSYHFNCDPQYVAMTTDYGGSVVAAIERPGVYGVQFHPERSHLKGLRLIKEFVNLVEAGTENGTKASC